METVKAKKKISIRDMVMVALMAALTCILAPLSIAIGPVPISLTNLVVYFSVILLGKRYGTLSYIVYLLIGLVGLPVFSKFQGGVAILVGPTGGYIIGFIFMAIIAGIFVEKFDGNRFMYAVGMVLGTLVVYAFGTAWFCYIMDMGVMKALSLCVFPFVLVDLGKIILAVIIAPNMKRLIKKATSN